MKTEKKELTPEEKKITSTLWMTIFPTLILAVIAIVFIPGSLWWFCLIVILLAIYEFILIKKLVEEFYRKG